MQGFAGDLFDAAGDGIAVQGSHSFQSLEDQKIERSVGHFCKWFRHVGCRQLQYGIPAATVSTGLRVSSGRGHQLTEKGPGPPVVLSLSEIPSRARRSMLGWFATGSRFRQSPFGRGGGK